MDSGWVAGAFGLIGVCVGVGLNVVVARHEEKRRDASDGRVAARMLGRELASAQDGIRVWIDRGNSTYPPRDSVLRFPAWERYHLLAARNFPQRDWERLSELYLRFYRIRTQNEFANYVSGEQKRFLEETVAMSDQTIRDLGTLIDADP